MLKELRDLRPMASSVLCVTFVASLMLTLSLGLTIVGAQSTDKAAQGQFSTIGGMQIALTSMAVILCIPAVVRLAIRRDSRRIALWQVIGASPRMARLRYIGLAAGSAIIGAVLGGIVGILGWPVFGRAVQETGLLGLPGLTSQLTVWAWVFGPLASFVVLLVTLLLGTRAIKNIEPVEAVTDTPDAPPRRSISRLVWSLLFAGGVAVGYIGISCTKPVTNPETIGGIVSAYWGAALGLLAAFGISDRIIIRPVVAFIGRIIPLSRLDAWELARSSARRRSVLSTSVITPLVVASASIGCIFGMVNQTRDVMVATSASVDDLQVSPTSQILLVFGSPVIIAAVAGVLAVYLTNEWRSHDIALLQVLGASISSIRWAAECECIVYFLSAAVITLLVLGVNAVAMGWALGAGPVPGAGITWIGNETFYFLVSGFLLLTVSIVAPSVVESRTLRMTAITQ